MHISAITIRNYRNFAELELNELSGSLVVLGENNAGKTNFLRAMQLVLDPGCPIGRASSTATTSGRVARRR